MAKKKEKAPSGSGIEKFWTAWNVIEAILLMLAGASGIVVGVISMISQDNPDLQNVAGALAIAVPFITGVFVVMDAIMKVVLSFTKFRRENDESIMLTASLQATIGIVLMIFFRSFTELVADFVAIFMMCIGTLLIVFSIYAIAKKKNKIFVPILEIVFASMLIAVGIAILIIYYQDASNPARQNLVLTITGTILFISGIVFVVMTGINRKKQKKAMETTGGNNDGYIEETEEEPKLRIEQEEEPKKIEKKDKKHEKKEGDEEEELPIIEE